MKRILLASLMSILFLCGNPAVSQDVLRPAAVVNDDIISLLDVAQRTQLAIIASGRKDSPDLRRNMLQQVVRTLIDERLKLQEAERLNIVISDQEIQSAFGKVAAQNNMSQEQLLDTLRKQGVLPVTLYDQFRAELAWRAVINARLRSTINITDAEIEEVVAKVQAEGAKTQKRIFEIFLGIDTASDEARVKQQADEALATINGGAQFSAIARQVSQSNSASLGGDLGWLQSSQLAPELQSAVASATPGTILGPIHTTRGYYILLIQDERSTRSEEKVHLKQFFFALPENPTFEQRQLIQSKAADARRKYESCSTMDALAKELGDQGSGDLGTINTKDLPPATSDAIRTVRVGEVSAPIQVSGGIAVIAVCDRQASGGIDRLAIEQKLADDRLDSLARRYLLDLRRSSNVDIRL
ncbi:peptidylprolyl isomerase [Kiloniella laminariae]|uniref:peptidylprolyl isomerase n=1 Tax=Kiloniella laminariae TaxID=454162 RepID=UPI0003771782|nr:peptidylprolyl isomerase [Kiloniella laminariae]